METKRLNNLKTTGNLLVLKASAGSGKTYNLAKQYIQHLLFTSDAKGVELDGKGKYVRAEALHLTPRRKKGDWHPLNAHRQILAITFTNKATEEMKRRIVKELDILSQHVEQSDYKDDFVEATGGDVQWLSELAQHALAELLFDYSNFNVSTIDSFFQTILRSFARELDRDFNYDIQLDADYAIRVAVHNFLLSLGKKQRTDVDDWVAQFQRQSNADTSKNSKGTLGEISGELAKFAKDITTEAFQSRMQEIRDYLTRPVDDDGDRISDFKHIHAFQQWLAKLVKEVPSHGDAVFQELKQYVEGKGMLDHLSGGKALKKALVKAEFSEWNPSAAFRRDANVEGIAEQFKAKAPNFSADELEYVAELANRLIAIKDSQRFFEQVQKHVYMMGMLGMIDLFLERYRHETNSILLADTNEMIATVLDSGVPFIYERVGSAIRHFMIDEFQDTSIKQYENFRSLIDESLANGHFNMLIGDAKQSIYRFRNADITVFRDRLDEDYGGTANNRPRRCDIFNDTLEYNYRSSRNIITFNNRLFDYVKRHPAFADNEVLQRTYGEVEQKVPERALKPSELPGYIRIVTSNYQGKPFASKSDDEAAGFKEQALAMLPDYLLWLHERFDWGKIGLLVNRNDEAAEIVATLLAHNVANPHKQIPVVSNEAMQLRNSPMVCQVISMLRFLDATTYDSDDEERSADDVPVDDIAHRVRRKRVNEQRFYSVLGAFIQQLNQSPDGDAASVGRVLADCFASRPARDAAEAPAFYQEEQSHLLPAADELTTLLSITENIIGYLAHMGYQEHETAFMLAFQDCVMQFCNQRNGGSVREFLRYWDENPKLSVNIASGDKVNIMTIHKAKGLEFDCVLLPLANWSISPQMKLGGRFCWMPREVFLDVVQQLMPPGIDMLDVHDIPPILRGIKSDLKSLMADGALGESSAAWLEKLLNDELIDNLNKTYVAVTRPRHELHIFTKPAELERDKTIEASMLFYGFARYDVQDYGEPTMHQLDAPTDLLQSFDAESGSGWYEMGTIVGKEHAVQHLADSHKLTAYVVGAIPASLTVRVEHAANQHIDAGIRLHSVLSGITSRNDVHRVVAQARRRGVVTDDPNDRCNNVTVERICDRIMNVQPICQWFDPACKVYSERPLVALDGENGRPDRIVVTPDGQHTFVIDYKSGEVQNVKAYGRQVSNYMRRLKLMGFPDVQGRIWYTYLDMVTDEAGNVLWDGNRGK